MSDTATAFTTAHKYDLRRHNVSKPPLTAYVITDYRMPRSRLRRYLGQFGLRGEALCAEVRRIAAGPADKKAEVSPGIYYTWPYGWQPGDFTPMMRRIFRGKRTRYLVMSDEVARRFAR
ncbi:TPA: hypothetical protein ACGB3K_004690 [Klebsiella aerogenes]|uniref:hypothetical protein n=1 Tax=Klebsiella aerogenes TaxID=548 RepID=UPI0028DDD769|nr:hypothetical protein [Klebsiella aerogenes]MDT8886000.1 hypothetical protein [Klebsiella aerogenes]HBV9945497.1 hypothetical protein [Klebsiella aerogenes]